MPIFGSSLNWENDFPGGLLPEIVDLILSAWTLIRGVSPSDIEIDINRRLRVALVQEKRARDLPIMVDREIPLDDWNTGKEIGRLDMRLIGDGCDEDVYFAIECKRLNVINTKGERSSLAGDYVDKGLARYISSKYARMVRQGGMVGFVMNGDCASAIDSVSRAIKSRAERVFLTNPNGLERSSVYDSDRVYETNHVLESKEFLVHHIFLPVVP